MMNREYIERELSDNEIDNLSIGEMKEILQAANKITEDGWVEKKNRNLKWNAMAILSMCGKAGLEELIPELWLLVEHPNPYFRDDAVTNLGVHFLVPEFKQKSHEIFLNDEDDNVRFRALGSWIAYHYETKNKDILEELYKISINDYNSNSIRERALTGILNVIGIRPKNPLFYEVDLTFDYKTSEQFNINAPWKEVITVLKKYAPEALKNYPIRKTKAENEQEMQALRERAVEMVKRKVEDIVVHRATSLSLEEIEQMKKDILG